MSRIRVNNLPKHATNDRLREFFSQKGEVTDAKVMHSKDGKERHFGFVGFRTEHEANEALKYFNKSFMGTSRITCEIALKVGDPNIPRPWSRYSLKKNKTSPEKENGVTGKKGDKSKAKKISKKKENGYADHDPLLQEFLQVMGHRSRSKLWANDAVAAPSLEPYKAAAVGKLPKLGEEVAEANGIVDDAAVSDTEYFKTKVRKEWSDSESCDNEPEDMSLKENDINSTNPSSVMDIRSKVLETGRLFIQNLPYSTTEEEVENYFSKFGAISQVHIVVDRDTKCSKGIAFVLFAVPECAARAIEGAHRSIFQGRLLDVLPAEPKIAPDKQEYEFLIHSSFLCLTTLLAKQRLSEKKASEANGNTQSWNSLYMPQDTVVEYIARKFGVSISDLFDRESDDPAVRIALAETQVVAETKRALSSAGINVASSEESAADKTDRLKRSNHVILVKNLPYSTSESELSYIFAKFGSLDKIILPPTKTLALVSFLEPAEARAAFSLHYKRYKDSLLYLEWAPENMNILSQTPETGNTVVGKLDEKRALLEQHFGEIPEADIDPDRVESHSLYITNLNFKTTDAALEKHFTEKVKQGNIKRVTVIKNEKKVSKGYGFIQFDSADTALKVRKDLQGTVLDGRALILQLSCPKKDETLHKKVEDGRSSTKLLVKNVAFEATNKDLRQLFSPFGRMKLRLPRKIGNGYRGYAFVEYVTKQEAENALRALSNTHLYGRHLVLEWAKERDGLEELRARTEAQFGDGLIKFSKKRKRMAVLDQGNTKFRRMEFRG